MCALVLMGKHLVHQDITTLSHSGNIKENYRAAETGSDMNSRRSIAHMHSPLGH